MADEGAGATISVASLTLEATSIQSQGYAREALETTYHGTTGGYKTYIPGDFKEPGSIALSFRADPDVFDSIKTALAAAAASVTITYPIPAGKSSGATEVISGFVMDFDGPAAEIDSVMEGTITVKKTGEPTFSDST